jgi:hypothetical protein
MEKVVGERSGEEEAASIIILQRIVSMFLKSKQQIIREQLHLKPQKQSKSLRASFIFHGKKGDYLLCNIWSNYLMVNREPLVSNFKVPTLNRANNECVSLSKSTWTPGMGIINTIHTYTI